MLNEYINVIDQDAKDMLEDLVIESTQGYGHDVYFIKRDVIDLDKILNESLESEFVNASVIEMYIENVEGFEGEGTLLSQFGLQIKDQANFIVSRKRYAEEVGEGRPREGDLIYYPLTKSLFEIKYVEHEKPFYQLNNLTTWVLQCELFDYSDEEFATGINEIDDIETDNKVTEVIATMNTTGMIEGYLQNDIVYVGDDEFNGTFAGEVKSFDINTGIIELVDTTGELAAADLLTNLRTAQGYLVITVDETDILPNDSDYADNQDLEDSENDLIVSLNNPFGDS